MDFFGGPAALGGIIMCVALGAWILGRWQGMVVSAGRTRDSVRDLRTSPSDHAAPDQNERPAPFPCQQATVAERRGALDVALSLGELHAEVSAYRRAEQVLADFAGDQLHLPARRSGARAECRYVGLTGQPTCAMPAAVRRACAEGDGCNAPPLAVQPSAFGSDFTRV